MKKALMIHPADNVAVVTEDTFAGEQVEYICGNEMRVLTAGEPVPIYHKIALRSLQSGEEVVKYGEVIGRAICEIPKGRHVHCHNTESPEKGGEKL